MPSERLKVTCGQQLIWGLLKLLLPEFVETCVKIWRGFVCYVSLCRRQQFGAQLVSQPQAGTGGRTEQARQKNAEPLQCLFRESSIAGNPGGNRVPLA